MAAPDVIACTATPVEGECWICDDKAVDIGVALWGKTKKITYRGAGVVEEAIESACKACLGTWGAAFQTDDTFIDVGRKTRTTQAFRAMFMRVRLV